MHVIIISFVLVFGLLVFLFEYFSWLDLFQLEIQRWQLAGRSSTVLQLISFSDILLLQSLTHNP